MQHNKIEYMNYMVKGFDSPKESKSGAQYCIIMIEGVNPVIQTFKALYFFKGEFDLEIGQTVELEVKDGKEPNQKIATKPKAKKAWSGSKAITFDEQKRLTAMTCAVELIISGKVEMKDLDIIKKRIQELI